MCEKLWIRHPKKSIIFADISKSNSTLESVVTLIATSKPLKSVLTSTDSLRSINLSVCFSLPPKTTERLNECGIMKIANMRIICDVGNEENNVGWRSPNRTRFGKILMCLIFDVIAPSLLVVPVLIWADT